MLDEAGQKSVARMKAPCSRFEQANHMNLSEIAKRAKVSTAVVSRTINRIPTVHRQLAKRVRKVMEEVGYYPNKQARPGFRAQPDFRTNSFGDHQSILPGNHRMF
jgi:hypothetical protein